MRREDCRSNFLLLTDVSRISPQSKTLRTAAIEQVEARKFLRGKHVLVTVLVLYSHS